MRATFTQSLFRLPMLRLSRAATHSVGTAIRLAGSALLALGVGLTAYAQERNSIESVTATTIGGGKVVIRATFKLPLTVIPNGFTVSNPARVAIDLPNVVNGLGKSLVDIGQGDVRSMNVVEAGSRTRLVINMSKVLTYAASLDGTALVIVLDGGAQSALKESAQVTR